MKTKIILIVILVLLFLYWRGVKNLLVVAKGWDCEYHIAYSVCVAKNNKAKLPSLFDILKAGVSF
jgi:hypothetical protein